MTGLFLIPRCWLDLCDASITPNLTATKGSQSLCIFGVALIFVTGWAQMMPMEWTVGELLPNLLEFCGIFLFFATIFIIFKDMDVWCNLFDGNSEIWSTLQIPPSG
ncbi:hypothetical protein POX_e07228 [Penicillium oxalicum]|uniref:Uncharacterized protein n=1 Tax=Penicillium oxalicum (strain 114-2 / CGMCC 5302) TaxID=933388 RepID=S8B1M5_PENO1|nr:hypothetical protein POX_e07228 [Penicillium oxalicum]EPS28257.1 hypothetical protein PDE_03203 [Penicillium oxalicum 114-2]KAI2789198.1 hypothetical protein POX_e07228 [Penicillium oxalicum]